MVETFDEAFWRLTDRAHRTAYRVLGIAAEAEDVAAETMARAALRWERLDTPADGWVVTVAARLAIDRQRRAWRSLPLTEDHEGPPDDVAARVDLLHALAALPKRQREVLALRFLSDYSEGETSELLGCSVSSVRTHAARGLARLRDLLDEPSAALLQEARP